MKMNSLTAVLVGTALFAATPVVAIAQDEMIVEDVTTITYLNGGIGKDEADSMRRIAHEFSLRLTFSAHKDGQFLADIPVVIKDKAGLTVFSLSKAGPLLDIMLPTGKYKVTASHHGISQTKEVVLSGKGKGGKDLHFHWNGESRK